MSAKKEGAAFPHPEKRPLGIFLIRSITGNQIVLLLCVTMFN